MSYVLFVQKFKNSPKTNRYSYSAVSSYQDYNNN